MTKSNKLLKCTRRVTKKYKTRVSPPYSAVDCTGKKQKGNDGRMYISKSYKRGVYRWVVYVDRPLNLPLKKYVTSENGERPFVVYDHGNKVTIFSNRYNKESNDYEVLWDKKIVIPYKKIFVGDKGGVILLQTGVGDGRYTMVGGNIKEFLTQDKDMIVRFECKMGNSGVPYPTAVGEKYVYFLLDNEYVPKEVMPSLKDDLYAQYYGIEKKYINSDVQSHVKKLRSVKYLVKDEHKIV